MRRITLAEQAALPIAKAALEGRGSSYGIADSIVFALGETGMLRLSAPAEPSGALSEQQRAALLEQLGDAQPATDGLLESFGKSIADRSEHSHPKWEDLFCMNLLSYMGERAAPVLRRLLDAEAHAQELRAERAAFADRVDTLTAVAKGNKRHVAELLKQLLATEKRITELEAVAADTPVPFEVPDEGSVTMTSCPCRPDEKMPCGHCRHDLCEDCGRCCSCTCASGSVTTGGERP